MKANVISKILFFGLSLLPTVRQTTAQPILDGRVTVSNLAVSRAEDKLFVSMEFDVSALHLESDVEMLLTPTLTQGASGTSLPPALIAGRNRYYLHLRNGLTPDDATLYRQGRVSLIEYRAVIPYEPWMNTAMLSARSEIRGCGGAPLAGADQRLTTLDLEPERRYFMPVPVYVRPEAEAKILTVEGSAYIDFPVNRTEIHDTYRNNQAELRKILATIDAVKADADTRIIGVKIKGYASPEGPYANNERLAKGRTQTLKEYVRRQYDFPESLLTTDYEPEDWAGLERFVETSGLNDREAILAAIRSDLAPDAKEWRIKKNYPEAYAYLLANVYPGLRHSDYAVKYEVRAYTDVAEIRRLLRTQPQKLSLQEMYMAAQEMEPGSDEYAETFEIAVRMFPDDATANLNAATTALMRGDLKRADGYLSKAGERAEAIYARGVLAALAERYDEAAALFGQAHDGGVTEAGEALRQVAELMNEPK
ncbi:DUF3868 domain-containing protein [Alistipes sp.]|uniref:DUF3868 domain-containing protein n=1 Tax=Alistipes sp. TaxID=1872444 RepID=UPI003A860FCC